MGDLFDDSDEKSIQKETTGNRQTGGTERMSTEGEQSITAADLFDDSDEEISAKEMAVKPASKDNFGQTQSQTSPGAKHGNDVPLHPSKEIGGIEALKANLRNALSTGNVLMLQRGLDELRNNMNEYQTNYIKAQMLYDVCTNNQKELCRILLREGAELQFEGHSFLGGGYGLWNYSLHQISDIEVLRVFVEERGTDVLNSMDDDAYRSQHGPQRATPLLRAALGHGNASCSDLLALGADPNCGEEEYELYGAGTFLPLHAGVVNHDEDLVRALIRHGATCDDFAIKLALTEWNSEDDGSSEYKVLKVLAREAEDLSLVHQTLVEAIELHSFERVRGIVRLGVIDLNKLVFSATPLRLAMYQNNIQIVTFFIDSGADPLKSEEGWDSDFQAAIIDGKLNFLKLFLQCWSKRFGASDNKNEDGDTPLLIVCQSRNASIQATKLVLDYEPSAIKEPDKELGLLPVVIASMWDLSLDIIFTLLTRYPEAISEPIPIKAAALGSAPSDVANEDDSDMSSSNNSNCKDDDNNNNVCPSKRAASASLIYPRSKLLRPPPESDDEDDSDSSSSGNGAVHANEVQVQLEMNLDDSAEDDSD